MYSKFSALMSTRHDSAKLAPVIALFTRLMRMETSCNEVLLRSNYLFYIQVKGCLYSGGTV